MFMLSCSRVFFFVLEEEKIVLENIWQKDPNTPSIIRMDDFIYKGAYMTTAVLTRLREPHLNL